MADDIVFLSSRWLELKHQEEMAVAERRFVEDKMTSLMNIKESLDGSETKEINSMVIKVTGRIDRKVNAALVQEIAAENGLTEHLSSLFRWTPAINMAVWKKCSPEITEVLLGAITSKPGRPSYKITFNEEL
jgi:hypothetical protein